MNVLTPELTDMVFRVQEEPDLDIALPRVFTQPTLPWLQRGRLPHVELLVSRLYAVHAEQNGAAALGPDYQALVTEFQPLFAWAIACWDYLLSTEGCRFLPRHDHERLTHRGEYRVVTDGDFSRLVHRAFRRCVFAFASQPAEAERPPRSAFRPHPDGGGYTGYPAKLGGRWPRGHQPAEQPLTSYLRAHFWDEVTQAYRVLEEPQDGRQRKLTPYSYLRCAPYQFLNRFHHELVASAVQVLPHHERQAIELYFLNFFTLEATAQAMSLPLASLEGILRGGLVTFLVGHRLVYCLLRQIERY